MESRSTCSCACWRIRISTGLLAQRPADKAFTSRVDHLPGWTTRAMAGGGRLSTAVGRAAIDFEGGGIRRVQGLKKGPIETRRRGSAETERKSWSLLSMRAGRRRGSGTGSSLLRSRAQRDA